MSGRTKKPVPRALPASIDATAGSAALTRSSIDPDAGNAAAVSGSVALDGRVSAMFPVTGATNVLDACVTGSCGAVVLLGAARLPQARHQRQILLRSDDVDRNAKTDGSAENQQQRRRWAAAGRRMLWRRLLSDQRRKILPLKTAPALVKARGNAPHEGQIHEKWSPAGSFMPRSVIG